MRTGRYMSPDTVLHGGPPGDGLWTSLVIPPCLSLVDMVRAATSAKRDGKRTMAVLPAEGTLSLPRIIELIECIDVWTMCNEERALTKVIEAMAQKGEVIDVKGLPHPRAVRSHLEPDPALKFVKIAGGALIRGGKLDSEHSSKLISAIASCQKTNVIIFAGSGPLALELAREIGCARLPEELDASHIGAPLRRYESGILDVVGHLREACRAHGLAAIEVPASLVLSPKSGALVPRNTQIVPDILTAGGVPLVFGGPIMADDTTAHIPSVEQAAVSIAKVAVPSEVLILTNGAALPDTPGRPYSVLSPDASVPSLSADAASPCLSESVPYYRELADCAFSVVVMDGRDMEAVRAALDGEREDGTQVQAGLKGCLVLPSVACERLQTHHELLADRVRVKAFAEAIEAIVQPGNTVMDFGTGTGLLAWLAARSGAARVHAIENEEVLLIAREMIKRSAQSISLAKNPPPELQQQSVDVLIAEVVGSFGIQSTSLEALLQVRDTYLSPKGRIIPQALELYVAPAWSASCAKRLSFWKQYYLGMDLNVAHHAAANQIYLCVLRPDDILGGAIRAANYDMRSCGTFDFSWRGRFTLEASEGNGPRAVNGLAGWFRIMLGDGVSLDTSPQSSTTSWYHTFFPFPHPVFVYDSAVLEAGIARRREPQGTQWRWHLRIKEDSTVHEFHQSCSTGAPVRDGLHRGTPYPWLGWDAWR